MIFAYNQLSEFTIGVLELVGKIDPHKYMFSYELKKLKHWSTGWSMSGTQSCRRIFKQITLQVICLPVVHIWTKFKARRCRLWHCLPCISPTYICKQRL